MIKQVLNMFEKAEAEYQALNEKKRIVGNDKAKIEKVRTPPGKCQIAFLLQLLSRSTAMLKQNRMQNAQLC